MKKIILVLAFFAVTAFSQSLLGLRYPAGITYPLSTTSARMGGVGTALKQPYLVSSLNPANLGSINHSVYTLSMNMDYVRVTEDDLYVDFSRFSPAFIGFAFPLGKIGTLAASFKQNGSNNYSYAEESYLVNSVLNDTISQIKKFENNNVSSAWEFGWGMEFARKISVGVSYQIGKYKNRISRSDVLMTTTAVTGLDSIYFNQSSPAIRGGILGDFGKLGVGVSVTYPFMEDLIMQRSIQNIKKDSKGNFTSPTLVHEKAVFDTIYRLQFPPSGSLGFSWKISDRLKTAADFGLSLWENYWTDAPALSYENGELGNAFSVATGLQFIPQPNLLSSRYFQKVLYSGGFAYRELPIAGDYEVSGSVGMGLPLGNRGIFDFSIETGTRKSKNESSINENFVRVNFGMSGGQIWKKASNNIY